MWSGLLDQLLSLEIPSDGECLDPEVPTENVVTCLREDFYKLTTTATVTVKHVRRDQVKHKITHVIQYDCILLLV